MPTITAESTIRRSMNIVFSDMAGDTVMMGIDQSEYYGLDAKGTRIWQLLEQEMRVEAICAILGSEYDVSETRCRDDVIRFLQELADHDAIDVSAA